MVIVPPSPITREVDIQAEQQQSSEVEYQIEVIPEGNHSTQDLNLQLEESQSQDQDLEPANSEEAPRPQTPEPELAIIVSTALSPVEEMSPSSATEVAPTPTTVRDTGSQSPEESTLMDTTVYVEPEIPDPFLIEEEDDTDASSSSDKEKENEVESEIEASSELPAAQEIALTVSTATTTDATSALTSPAPSEPLVLSPLNLNKDVPPPPSGEEEEEEEEPDLFLPGLIIPTMFLPIPNVRRSFYSSNMLLWWLPKSSSMYMCNRRIL